ncbi:MAG TPA: maltose alpha-D-glucosyltransferase, partial [Thermomicrobiales bacterium]|nr:maltose alpha-D-glucosyltransferase [Thermomicrobiales bacterium]
FFPSPLKDDGYDIADYVAVHPAYGTLDDFRRFLDEAHARGLKVIIELVLNHTSDQHPWFQRARQAPAGSSERDFYVWSDTTERYRDARVIFQDYEQSNWTWDGVANAYYWHRFYAHQPDLNYDHPPVRESISKAVDFWLKMGVDGLRLDAVPYLVERDGTTCENLPETHDVLKELRAHVDARFPHRMLLAEANQWPEDAVAYFGDGDECHMAFHFPLMPRLFMAVRTEDRLPVIDIMEQTPPIPESAQWALFLRNHDELTLEMVTEEERISMYRAFAPAAEARINLGIRHRLAPLLRNSRRRIELLNALMCSLPGTPVIYYGDEIGMGDNIYLGDRDGVRTPMQWSADRNAGFSSAPQQRLYLPLIVDYEYHHETVHVEAQEQNPHSLLAFMRRLLALRKHARAFGRGSLTFLHPDNQHVLAFVRAYEDERILVVANLSRYSQAVELDLRDYCGLTPVELFGRSPFWAIDDSPYRLTLGPHTFHWFTLAEAPAPAADGDGGARSLPLIDTVGAWDALLAGRDRGPLEQALPAFLGRQPWFRGQTESVLAARLLDVIPLHDEAAIALTPIAVTYTDREPEMYLLALQAVPFAGDEGQRPEAAIARLRTADGDALLIDAIAEGTIHVALGWLARQDAASLPGGHGEVVVLRTAQGEASDETAFTTQIEGQTAEARSGKTGKRVLAKFLRRINEGVNPEWEIGATLTDAGFPHTPTVLGALEYRPADRPPITLAVLQTFVPNDGNAWERTLAGIDRLLDVALAQGPVVPGEALPTAQPLLDAAGATPPPPLAELLRPALDLARLLGRRTAELHFALASLPDRPAFTPEPQTSFSQRSLYQSMRGLTTRVMRAVRRAQPEMSAGHRRLAEALIDNESEIHDRLRRVLARPMSGSKIRAHGDYHLEQVLITGDDVVIVDFEGEPDRYSEERRLKTSPLRDVASMLQSFRNAAATVGERHAGEMGGGPEERATSAALLRAWYRWSAAAFLDAYLTTAGEAAFLPMSEDECAVLLDAMILEKAIYEVGYALDHTPDRLALALRGVLELIGKHEGDDAPSGETA